MSGGLGFNSWHETSNFRPPKTPGSSAGYDSHREPSCTLREARRVTVPAAPLLENTAAVIVTYQPEPGFAEHLEQLLTQFDGVFLVDNSGVGSTPMEFEHARLRRLDNRTNLGLGVALNQGCKMALDAGYEWVVTLDQDSVLDSEFLPAMIGAWARGSTRPVLLGCNYFSASRGAHKLTPDPDAAPLPLTTVITSGTLMHLASWHSIGGFREDFFIDAIDHELCLRARSAGFTVALFPGLMMQHSIGDQYDSGNWLGRWRPYRHSPLRDFTNARNTTRVLLEYFWREPFWCLRRTLGLVAELLAVLVFESQKWRRLQCFMVGVGHGISGNMGPLPEFVVNE